MHTNTPGTQKSLNKCCILIFLNASSHCFLKVVPVITPGVGDLSSMGSHFTGQETGRDAPGVLLAFCFSPVALHLKSLHSSLLFHLMSLKPSQENVKILTCRIHKLHLLSPFYSSLNKFPSLCHSQQCLLFKGTEEQINSITAMFQMLEDLTP